MSDNTSSLDFIAVGLSKACKGHLEKLVDGARVKYVDTVSDFEALLDGFELDDNATIFVGNAIPGIEPIELGQGLRGCFVNAHIVFLATDPKSFSLSVLKKNGYSKALLLPLDLAFFDDLIVSSSRGGIRKRYKAIKMVDISPNEHLDFSVYIYMPANKKYVLLTPDGNLSEKKYKLLKARSQTTVFVEADEVDKFYTYSAEKLAKLTEPGEGNGSITERSERLRQHIQSLFHNILDQNAEADYNTGRDLMEQSHQIVQKFVANKTKLNLKDQISIILDIGSDSYSHAQAVSSLACLLSMAVEIGKPEELAIAGLFHDIGVIGFEVEPNPLTMDKLTPEEMTRYADHPLAAANMLRAKKFVLTPSVAEIIEKHHERVDGKGFPSGLLEHKIPLAAQLLAFTDWFEYLMRPVPGEQSLTALQATEIIQTRAGLSPELISKIKKFFKSLEELEDQQENIVRESV